MVALILEGCSPHGQFNYQCSNKDEQWTCQLICFVDIDKE